MLESFPRQADTVNISARLLIGDNPWRCSCDNSWMIGWLQSLFYQISDPGDITCASPSRMHNRYVLKSTREDFCVDPVKRVLTITLSVVASVAAVILLLVITGKMLYNQRVTFYKMWKFHPFDRDECAEEDIDYDVFLCCSSLDHDPHGRRIRRAIESNGYRVCYHEEDYTPGQLITDNMAQSVERSKRTVCLISNNFLQRYRLIWIHVLWVSDINLKRTLRAIYVMVTWFDASRNICFICCCQHFVSASVHSGIVSKYAQPGSWLLESLIPIFFVKSGSSRNSKVFTPIERVTRV